ncbi:MAG: hypothetical protein H7X89_00800 [Rhizobiales bacterium]|nr:hypothetical protein [Hyphomicrobiales bacterium]
MAKSSRAGRRKRNGNGASHHGLFDDILAMAGSLAGSRKDYAATKLETLAESVREIATAVPGIPNFTAYANAAAGSLEDLAGYVTESDLETMVSDARQFARTHPMATLAGSIAAGLIVTQMMYTRAGPGSGGRRSRANA